MEGAAGAGCGCSDRNAQETREGALERTQLSRSTLLRFRSFQTLGLVCGTIVAIQRDASVCDASMAWRLAVVRHRGVACVLCPSFVSLRMWSGYI